MTTIITATYLCRSVRRSVDNVGTEQSLAFEANVFDPVGYRKEKTRVSNRRNTKRFTRVRSARQRRGRIEIPLIEPADVTHWWEFFESVDEDDVFELAAPGYWGIDETFDVYIPDLEFDIARIETLDIYRTGFNFEEAA